MVAMVAMGAMGAMGGMTPGSHAVAGTPSGMSSDEHSMANFRIHSTLQFLLSAEGLANAPEMGAVLADRARALSKDPAKEDVLIVAHGPGDDEENRQWLAALDRRADAVRAALPFHSVAVRTLREDWPEKRSVAEGEIRQALTQTTAAGRTTLVIPFRVQGFGPYAEVLSGLTYVSDGQGLLPHPNVAAWISRQVAELTAAPPAPPAPPPAKPGRTGLD